MDILLRDPNQSTPLLQRRPRLPNPLGDEPRRFESHTRDLERNALWCLFHLWLV